MNSTKHLYIRTAQANDADDVYALVCLLEDTHVSRTDFDLVYTQNIKNENVAYFLAICKHEVIGFASVHIQYLLHHAGRVAEIQELIIAPLYRGSGAGKLLVAACRAFAEDAACALLEVSCNRRRIAAHQFYEGYGFTRSHYKFTMPFNKI